MILYFYEEVSGKDFNRMLIGVDPYQSIPKSSTPKLHHVHLFPCYLIKFDIFFSLFMGMFAVYVKKKHVYCFYAKERFLSMCKKTSFLFMCKKTCFLFSYKKKYLLFSCKIHFSCFTAKQHFLFYCRKDTFLV